MVFGISESRIAFMTSWSLSLIGIGAGHPDHLTLAAITALKEADVILVPLKGAGKEDLADLRRAIIARHAPDTPLACFDLPQRGDAGGYLAGVEAWHDAIAARWREALEQASTAGGVLAGRSEGRAAILIWGDPSLYDSSLRIAGRLDLPVRVVPGITALQALTAAHRMALNTLGAPVLITTGRRLRETGWPDGQADTIAVMLDGACSFQTLDPRDLYIWWGAFVSMPEEILISGPLAEVGPEILARRAQARADHGWIMDAYLLRKSAQAV